MEMIGTFIWTLIMLGAAVYAQYRIPFHTANAAQSWVTRLILGVIGVGIGIISVDRYQEAEGIFPLLAFLNGFGAVHVPAAFILFIKRQRGEGLRKKDSQP
ncbi:hypothetical protein [Nitrosococcus wardiae]|uniref:Uncharacterized protein n=1 Tax=Nitrosococcus wardiae TaxID=1814290 RepID=A0A4P7C038_9GAMM|nr:hypothetical protein [Nitrosococcus wardiae]QBQ54066.1 hypothetical protein E3U44_05775 [Nitrosococcus wardiae]